MGIPSPTALQPKTGWALGELLIACLKSTSCKVYFVVSSYCSRFQLKLPSSPGPAEFARLVANIAPSLQTLRAQQESITSGIFVYRLMFAVRLAEFHQRRLNGELQEAAFDIVSMLRDDIAPKAWWAVILFDAVELLQNGKLFYISHCLSLHLLTVARFQRRCCSPPKMHVCSCGNWKRSALVQLKGQARTISRCLPERPRIRTRSRHCNVCRSFDSRWQSITLDAVLSESGGGLNQVLRTDYRSIVANSSNLCLMYHFEKAHARILGSSS